MTIKHLRVIIHVKPLYIGGVMTSFDLWTIIGSMAAMCYYIHRDIQKDIREQSKRTDEMNMISTARSDKLYQMFIDLLREKK